MHRSTIRFLCCLLASFVACNVAVAQQTLVLHGSERISVAQGFDFRGFAQVGESDRLELAAIQQKSATDQPTPAASTDSQDTDKANSEPVKEPSDSAKKSDGGKEKDASQASDKDKT